MKIHESYVDVIDYIIANSSDDYYRFVFEHPLSFYEERIAMAGFQGHEKVLDAGCGYGQWSIALSKYNKHIVSIDHNEAMLNSLKYLIDSYKINNISMHLASLPKLEFDDNSFDAVWCWSVFMFLNRDKMLKEFHRVLKVGGRIMIGSKNSRGRILYKIVQAIKGKNFQAAKIEIKNLFYGKNIHYINNYTLFNDVKKLYEPYGFKVIAQASEGFIDLSGIGREKPIFPPKFLGMYSNIEFILEKI